MDVGANIRKARKIRGLTQIDVAEMAEIAVNSLRLYEAGKRTPNLEQLQHIARAIGVEWPSLVDGDLIWADEYAIFGGEKRNARTIPEGLEAMLNRLGRCLIGLNDEGRQKVEDYAKDLAQMPKYQREQPRQTPPSTSESNDTPLPPDAPETPPEGK